MTQNGIAGLHARLVEQYERQHTASKAAHEKAKQVLPAGNTRSVLSSDPFPLVIRSAEGSKITTVDGVTLEDFVSDFSAGIYGHSHPTIKAAVQEALDTGLSLGSITEKEAELGRILTKRFPSLEKVRFCNSGTEANTFAIAAAIAYTKRPKVLVFTNGYHGGTISFPPKPSPMNLPHQFVIAPYDNIEETRAFIDGDLAAILVEPMQGAGGMRPASRDFLLFLREAATRVGAVLIFDEVVTSRLHYSGVQGALGVHPDMTTLGKYLGGGLPFGAFGGSSKLMDQFDPAVNPSALHHSGTFNNNIFTMSAGVAAGGLITEESLESLNRLGDRVRNEANSLMQSSGFSRIRFIGYGSAVGIYFPGEDGDTLRECFYFSMLNRGINIGKRGFMFINLAHTDASVDMVVEAVSAFVAEVVAISE
ncbi:putative acetylornithine aminotransferase [Aspergillus karnatakaensis]|uniref:aspartate aminotransferase family protein n=1 Tax=Aspergillus karnatakaensis TaxID=1810916 RepID=UPI003CCDEAD2